MKSILVVDDEKDIRDRLKKHIGKKGYNVITASSIKTAKEFIVNEELYCVIIDLTLDSSSEFGGMEVFHFARSNKIHIIFLSAYVFQTLKENFEKEIKTNILKEIEKDYIHKGGENNYIRAVIDKLIKIENRKNDRFVFISYAREDREVAIKLYNNLVSYGINAWIDIRKLLPGQKWKDVIIKAINQCSHFIAIFSENSVSKRGYVQKEVAAALEILEKLPSSSIYFIPVRLDECEPSHNVIHDICWVDMFPSWDEGEKLILKAITQ